MKVTFQTQDLCRALERVQRAAQTKVTSNTNNGFFISAEDGKVEFQANDYSIGIRTFCEADVEERGSVLISAPHLLSTIKMMPSGPVVMEQKKGESTVFFKAGQYNSHFPTRDTAEFPLVTEIDHAFHVNMKCKDFAEMVNLVSFAASTDAKNPIFTGILCDITENIFTMAATNSHRLAAREISLEETPTGKGNFIVSASVLQDVIRLLPAGEDSMMEISWASRHVAFSFGETYFLSNLINGVYPDYKRVFPSSFDLHATLDLKDFEEDPDIGRSETSIPAELDGADVKITFNCTYVEDILKHSKGEKIILHVKKNGPMVVEQEEDKAYRYVVTPMRGR